MRRLPLKRIIATAAALVIIALPTAATAQTVFYNVVPASDESATLRTVLTGSQIQYNIYAQVFPEVEGVDDNSGLAAIIINIETDLGREQPPVEFLNEIITDSFLFPSKGTPFDDDLLEIGGAQATFAGELVTGIGENEPFLVASGFFQTPDFEGTFTVRVSDDSSANIFTEDEFNPLISAAFVDPGPGFTIVTDDDADVDPGPGGDPNDGSDPNDGMDPNDGTDPNDGSDPNDSGGGGIINPDGGPLSAFAALGVMLAMLGIGFAIFGPWGLVGALLLGSVVGLVILAGG